MSDTQLILDEMPELSGKTASELIDFLYALTTAIENQHFAQIRLYHQQLLPGQYDLLEPRPDTADTADFDDPLPDF